MKTFSVCKREVWNRIVTVKAQDGADALKKVIDGEGINFDDNLEYSRDVEEEGAYLA